MRVNDVDPAFPEKRSKSMKLPRCVRIVEIVERELRDVNESQLFDLLTEDAMPAQTCYIYAIVTALLK